MERFEIEVNLNHLRDAREGLNTHVRDFNTGFDTALKRLLHEAAHKMMSPQQVGKMAGMSTAAVKAKMKKFGLNPNKGKTLLSREAAEVLASNAEVLGIEPHKIDLMSPLAYLPAGKDLFPETTRSHVTDLDPTSVSQELGIQIAEVNYCGHCDGMCEQCQAVGVRAVAVFKEAWEKADAEGRAGHRVEDGLAAALKSIQMVDEG